MKRETKRGSQLFTKVGQTGIRGIRGGEWLSSLVPGCLDAWIPEEKKVCNLDENEIARCNCPTPSAMQRGILKMKGDNS